MLHFCFWCGLTTPVGLLVTPTDRPKSVRNRCVIEVFGGVCVCCPLVFEFSVGIGGFVIGLGQISFFFSLKFSACKSITLRNHLTAYRLIQTSSHVLLVHCNVFN